MRWRALAQKSGVVVDILRRRGQFHNTRSPRVSLGRSGLQRVEGADNKKKKKAHNTHQRRPWFNSLVVL